MVAAICSAAPPAGGDVGSFEHGSLRRIAGATSDDEIMSSLEGLMVTDLLVTENMDGENTTIHRGGSTPAVLTAATTRRVKSCRANLIPEDCAAIDPADFAAACRTAVGRDQSERIRQLR